MEQSRDGFTVVEIVVTVVIAGIFLITLIQSFRAIASQQESVARYAKANDIARINLSKYRSVGSLGRTCDPALTSTTFYILNDSSPNREATPTGNYPNFSQNVTVQWERGCSAPPVVKSIVTYGPATSTERIVQSSYAR
jgi:type II secretory pathway pseudopilin PulG